MTHPRLILEDPAPAPRNRTDTAANGATRRTRQGTRARPASAEPKIEAHGVNLWFRTNQVLKDVHLKIPARSVTAIIGPSGCGKTTFLRALNRMHDFTSGSRMEGKILMDGEDIHGRGVNPVLLRTRVGMVFQKPNPFPTMSIRDNLLFAPKRLGLVKRKLDAERLVQETLKRAALWDEVKDRLDAPATSLSGGQQQRLCIARALAVKPEVLLMDEPCSALDPIATGKIEDLIVDLKKDYTVVIVTHNMQQAARVSDFTAYFYLGELVEFDATAKIFENPDDERTEAYITGRFG